MSSVLPVWIATGFSLWIKKQDKSSVKDYDIVRANGGELFVETEEGEGSVFSITLPAK